MLNLKAAIIGVNWGIRTHYKIFKELGWQIDLICGKNYNSLKSKAFEYGIKNFTTNYEDVFNTDFDLIIIALPWQLHQEVYYAGIQSKSHLFIEHPLSPQLDISEKLANKSKIRDLKCIVNFPNRFIHPVQELKYVLDNGILPEIQLIKHRFFIPLEEETDWIPIIAIHSLDLANWLFNIIKLDESDFDYEIDSLENCCTWSWPMLDNNNLMFKKIKNLKANFKTSTNEAVYSLEIGFHSKKYFLEDFQISGKESYGYFSKLIRQNEFSPWKISSLRNIESGKPVKTNLEFISYTRDGWLNAHYEQIKIVTDDILNSRNSNSLATFEDCHISHNWFERICQNK